MPQNDANLYDPADEPEPKPEPIPEVEELMQRALAKVDELRVIVREMKEQLP